VNHERMIDGAVGHDVSLALLLLVLPVGPPILGFAHHPSTPLQFFSCSLPADAAPLPARTGRSWIHARAHILRWPSCDDPRIRLRIDATRLGSLTLVGEPHRRPTVVTSALLSTVLCLDLCLAKEFCVSTSTTTVTPNGQLVHARCHACSSNSCDFFLTR
jgi:hypothetical protein